MVLASAQSAFITNGLVAFYPFSGNFLDQSGGGTVDPRRYFLGGISNQRVVQWLYR